MLHSERRLRRLLRDLPPVPAATGRWPTPTTSRGSRPASSTTSSRATGVTPALGPRHADPQRRHLHGATAGGTGRTRINVIQYAIYGDRGEWIASELRYLWEHGCNVAIIYSVGEPAGADHPAQPLRTRPDPDAPVGDHGRLRHDREVQPQQVDDDRRALGHVSRRLPDLHRSANWADLALGDDEQMQRIVSRDRGRCATCATSPPTWRQRSSHMPGYGVLPEITGRRDPDPAPATSPRTSRPGARASSST